MQQMTQTFKEQEARLVTLKAKLKEKEEDSVSGEESDKELECSESSSFSVVSSEKECKIAVVREVERTLDYRKRHVKCKGNRSFPTVSPASSSSKRRKARAPVGEVKGKSSYKKLDKEKTPVHCFFAERNKGRCYLCNKSGHKAYHCPLRSK